MTLSILQLLALMHVFIGFGVFGTVLLTTSIVADFKQDYGHISLGFITACIFIFVLSWPLALVIAYKNSKE